MLSVQYEIFVHYDSEVSIHFHARKHKMHVFLCYQARSEC